MKLTADTITDDQIRALRDSCGPSSPYRIHCGIALDELDGALWHSTRDSARARCAEILNAHAACTHEREEHPPGIDPRQMAHYLASRTLLTEAECAELDRSQPETIRALIAGCATRSIPAAAQMLRSVLTRPDPPQAPNEEAHAHGTELLNDRTK